MLDTPFFVSCQYKNFEEYYNKLSLKSKQNYNHISKKFINYEYKLLNNQKAREILPEFEEIWSNQIIHNKKGSKPSYSKSLNNSNLVFLGYKNNVFLSVHVVVLKENYIYCHQPLYDKLKNQELSKFMWFKLIKYVIENTNYIGIDLGGPCGKKNHFGSYCLIESGRPCNPNTKFIINNRKLVDKYEYKFLYLTKEEKDPNKCKNYIIIKNKVENIDTLEGVFYVVWYKNIEVFNNKNKAIEILNSISHKYMSCLYVKINPDTPLIEVIINSKPKNYNEYREIESKFLGWINSYPK